MKRIIYYSDEHNDDFAELNIEQKKLPSDYSYFSKNPLRLLLSFFLYYMIAAPLVFLIQKTVYHEKIVGREKLRPYRKTGFFLYGNHTRVSGDAYTPALITFPKKAYIVANPDSVSIPGIRHLVEDLGTVPISSDIAGMKRFLNAVRVHADRHHAVVIYPEAHIWPYYTQIRPFKEGAFRYPALTNKPVFCFTVTYQKRRFFDFPRTTVYIDGPFFADNRNTMKQNQIMLRNRCYDAMERRSKNSTYQHVTYIRKDQQQISTQEGNPL